MGIFGFIYGKFLETSFFIIYNDILKQENNFKICFTIIKDLIKVDFMIPSGFVVYLFNEHQRFILEDLSGLSSLGVLTVILSIV